MKLPLDDFHQALWCVYVRYIPAAVLIDQPSPLTAQSEMGLESLTFTTISSQQKSYQTNGNLLPRNGLFNSVSACTRNATLKRPQSNFLYGIRKELDWLFCFFCFFLDFVNQDVVNASK